MELWGWGEDRWWWSVGTLTANSRGDVAATFKGERKKPSDRYSGWSLCCDDLNYRRLPTSQYQILIGVIVAKGLPLMGFWGRCASWVDIGGIVGMSPMCWGFEIEIAAFKGMLNGFGCGWQ